MAGVQILSPQHLVQVIPTEHWGESHQKGDDPTASDGHCCSPGRHHALVPVQETTTTGRMKRELELLPGGSDFAHGVVVPILRCP